MEIYRKFARLGIIMLGLGISVFEHAFKNIDDDMRDRVLVLGSLYEDSLLQTIRGLL